MQREFSLKHTNFLYATMALGGSPWPSAYMDAQNINLAYDALVVLGSSLNEKNTLGPAQDSHEEASSRPVGWSPQLSPKGPFIQVDANQGIIGRGYDITKGIVAELSVFIDLTHGSLKLRRGSEQW